MTQIEGKTPWLTLHVPRPLQSETPLALLRVARVTDKAHLYVRNNQDLDGAMVLTRGAENWQLTLSQGEREHTLTLPDLRAYLQYETEMVLQCSGNSRGRFSGVSPVSGSRWQDGAVANVVFGGARLRDVLEGSAPDLMNAAYLTVRGAGTRDEDDTPPFERSVPLADVLDTALLALTLNGEPLPALHGGPAAAHAAGLLRRQQRQMARPAPLRRRTDR